MRLLIHSNHHAGGFYNGVGQLPFFQLQCFAAFRGNRRNDFNSGRYFQNDQAAYGALLDALDLAVNDIACTDLHNFPLVSGT